MVVLAVDPAAVTHVAVTEPPHRRRPSPPSTGGTDPFGRPIDAASDGTDPFGRPLRPATPRPTAAPWGDAPPSSPDEFPWAVTADESAAPVPPAAPKPLGVPDGFPRASTVAPPPAAPPSTATTALLLGIGGIFFLPLLLSIPAWVVGARARRESRALPGRPGYGMATTGWLLGIFGTIGWVLLGVLMMLVLVLAVGTAGLAETD